MYRPEGFINPHSEDDIATGWVKIGKAKKQAYEAGADAILEALDKIPDRLEIHECNVTLRLGSLANRITYGTWVFIPDEKE